jgi:two-component system sensor histidine kinase AlgZ
MHPIFRSRTGLLAYLVAWVPFGAMFGFVLTAAGHLRWTESLAVTAPLTVVLAFVCLSPWYSCRFLPLGSTPVWKLLLHHIIAAMCASALVVVVARVLVTSMRGAFPGIDQRLQPAVPVFEEMVGLVYLLSIALHYVMLTIESSRQAEVLSREAELKALKAQVNPHFLFNSLHSISALTSVDPAKARDMCIHLSDFLRSSLRLGERVSIPFGEELALAKTYLDVEQVRFGERLRVKQEFDPACADCEVPPLLVQPLVENAIKHGIATLIEGGEIAISGKRSRDGMRFIIENPFDPDAPSTQKSGFGLSNVRSRLHARYGNAARLEVQVERNRYRVILSLPIEAARVLTGVGPTRVAL